MCPISNSKYCVFYSTIHIFSVISLVSFDALAARNFSSFSLLSFRSLKRLPKSSKCGRMTIVNFTNSSIQSTNLSRLPLGKSLALPLPSPPSSSNALYAIGKLLWFAIVNIRIHLPNTLNEFTALKLWDPPLICITESVRPCVGRTEPVDRGIQSISISILAVNYKRSRTMTLTPETSSGICFGIF